MTTEIKIRYDGTAPGLAEGHLSLGAFLPALQELLRALRRIGSNYLTDATGSQSRGAKGGRLHRDAEVLDLVVSKIDHNCLSLEMIATATPRPGDNLLPFGDLPERAGAELLSSIEKEGLEGMPRNLIIRNYFDSLPAGIAEQRYQLCIDGKVTKDVSVGVVAKRQQTTTVPALRECVGKPVGVVFGELNPQIRLEIEGEGAQWYDASRAHVDAVLDSRGAGSVRALIVFGSGHRPRILRMSIGSGPLPMPSQDEISERLRVRWAGLMRRLA